MEKLYWAELRKEIAQRINAEEKEVGQFMNALAPAIIKALQEDRQVRISNFGTFKLQTIAPRKSVNVATGESFTLPGYDKLTFTPESSVKELLGNLNGTAAPSSKTEDNATPLQKLGEQANEIVGILNDLGQNPEKPEETTVEENKPEEPVIEEPVTETPVAEEPVIEEPIAEEPKEEPKETNMSEENNIQEPFVFTSSSKKEEKKKDGKKGRTWLVVGITVLIFAILAALAFLFLGNRFVEWVEDLQNRMTDTTTVVAPETDVITDDITSDEQMTDDSNLSVVSSSLPYPYEYKEFIAKEYLPEGSRLAWLARKYYNERDLWVFIYEANKNVIAHPSLIEVGTLIRIPKLPKELRDLSNPELRELVDRLAEEYKQL